MTIALLGFLSVSSLYLLAQLACLLRAMRRVPRVAALSDDAPPGGWPRVSAVVPARDEEAHLAQALATRLEDPYPELEIVVVDDRSTDATGRVAAELAAADSRVRAIRVDALREGWLGKVHAMERGLEQASGAWVLFSDADVRLSRRALSRIVAHAEREGIDHVAVIPGLTTRGPLIAPAVTTFFRLFSTLTRLWAVPDPRSSALIGSGAFNLVRRAALDRTAGLAWLRMEIADDVALGALLKSSGARQTAMIGGEDVALELYPSVVAMTRALEKNGGSAPAWRMLLGIGLLVLVEAGYLAAFAEPALALPGLSVYALAALTAWLNARWLRVPTWPAWLPFLGVFPLAWAIARSAILCALRGGVTWRGTFYPREVVVRGRRVGVRGPVPAPP